jgi:hypothetical protein
MDEELHPCLLECISADTREAQITPPASQLMDKRSRVEIS